MDRYGHLYDSAEEALAESLDAAFVAAGEGASNVVAIGKSSLSGIRTLQSEILRKLRTQESRWCHCRALEIRQHLDLRPLLSWFRPAHR
jgi:hypothetical protein